MGNEIDPEDHLDTVMSAEVAEPDEAVRSSRKAQVERNRMLRIQALQLRTQGHSYSAIAEHLKVDPRTVATLIDSALTGAETAQRESIIAKRALESQRLDRLLVAYYLPATQGNQKAFDNVLKLHDRKVRLEGLAVPQQINLNVSIRAEMEAALSELESVLQVIEGDVVHDSFDEQDIPEEREA